MARRHAGSVLAHATVFAVLLLAAACERNGDMASTSPAPDMHADTVVARIGGRDITLAEADAAVANALHELDHERYRLRRESLEAVLLRQLEGSRSGEKSAQILLRPPVPSPITLEGTPAASRPNGGRRPVTVTVFCNFESPHCADVQSTLADLLALHPDTVQVAARDLPLPMHRLAPLAAEAARCAGRQGHYWPFHDGLRAGGRTPERPELERVAAAVGLDRAKFERCLAAHETAGEVAADQALAHRLGLGMVPAVFVNGRRATAPITADQLLWLVSAELGDAKSPAIADVPLSRLPIRLRATLVGERPGLGLAVFDANGRPRVVREGERASSNAILRRVDDRGAQLLVEGRPERVDFEAQSSDGASPAAPVSESRVEPPGAVPASPGAIPVYLDRETVRARLADRVALARELAPVAMTVDGYRLLQLRAVQPGSLYELLGLQAGDVIVAVNEQPIHEGDNPLWDALDREREVRVRVMRRGGRAQHYTYRVE
jgi:protein-disulfide isomerase/type II secretory pathway component PulC